MDNESAREFVNLIVEFNKDDEGIPVDKRQPITIYINSCGGTVQDGYAIIDAIALSKTPVHTVGLSAYSMGALVLLAGHKRAMYPSGSVMFHEGSASIFGDAGKVKDTMRFYEKQLEIAKQMMFTRTKITPELYEKKEDNDWYLTAQEALELGVVDELATNV